MENKTATEALHNLYRGELGRQLRYGKQAQDEFAAKFAADPGNAFRWSDGAMDAAAKFKTALTIWALVRVEPDRRRTG